MFSYKDVQIVLQQSQWDKADQDKLADILPHLGSHTLHFLFHKVGSIGSEALAAEFIEIGRKQARWYAALPKGDTGSVQREFYETWRTASVPGELMLFNIVRDIRANNAINEAVSEELSNAFNYLTCSLMDEAGAVDVAQILSHGALQAATFCNLSGEVKRYCYLKDINDTQSREVLMFVRALENNSEQLGTVKLDLVTGTQPPTVKNWLEAFLEMGSKQAERSNYNVAYFMTNHPVAAKLPQSHKDQLADILRLYNWLHVLTFVPEEFEKHEDEREAFFAEAKQYAINFALGLLNPNAKASVGATRIAKATPEQLSSMRDIADAENRDVQYGGKSMRDIMDNRPYKGPKGLALDQQTNIVVNEEKVRMQQNRDEQKASIEKKLQELRNRNNS